MKIANEKEVMNYIITRKMVLDELWRKLALLDHNTKPVSELRCDISKMLDDLAVELLSLENEIHRQDNKKK